MYYLDSVWDVNTRCSRRPTPLTYAHLRKYAALDLKYQTITSQITLVEIQKILDQQATLYMPSEIRFVIAQLLGLFGTKFVTIHSTEDGAVHIYPMGGTTDGVMDVALGAGTEEIGKVQLLAGTAEIGKLAAGVAEIGKVRSMGSGQTLTTKAINMPTGGTVAIIAAASGVKHKITSLLIIVAGQTNLTLKSATDALSGPMDLGGTNEPRGFFANHGDSPFTCATNEAFNIVSSGAVQISGYVIYYDEA